MTDQYDVQVRITLTKTCRVPKGEGELHYLESFRAAENLAREDHPDCEAKAFEGRDAEQS